MKRLDDSFRKLEKFPTKVIQFGEGNFLRAFIDWQIHQMNKQGLFKGGVKIVQPLAKGMTKNLDQQDDLYTVLLEGVLNGKKYQSHEVIESVNGTVRPYENYAEYLKLAEDDNIEVIFSNTTEAGIAFDENDKLSDQPQNSYPGKLTALLYHRFELGKKGFHIIPCELINHNGDQLKKIVLQYAELWKLGEKFVDWINNDNKFYSTLVDRIVPGYPRDRAADLEKEWGYLDQMMVKTEPFLIFVLEGSQAINDVLPLKEAGINFVVTDDMQPYRNRKVSILNGPHTTMSPIARLAGIETVGEVMKDKDFYKFVNDEMYQEIIPTVALPEKELADYAEGIKERFENPYVKHQLSSIALNSISKFTARLLPTLKRYVAKNQELPKRIVLALAAYLKIYRGQADFEPSDTAEVLAAFKEIAGDENYVHEALSNSDFWGEDLTQISGLEALVNKYLTEIDQKGTRAIVERINAE
ncbi:tagaturonate reductase [Liquorilactobacillus nagelii]|jgi:tagaturonate reductase|uniref:tagaturonate reductase n=1 Tax=Liquorilactobacillus nagelii TaxID=82688 RepID=UPI0006F0F8B3|nr:tagaturonate reductase [Liquorilactobacillus nagelii]KRL41864.1 altronate oxidoreductase [Liquorilactobacillus nagelii DSM 13675]MCI1700574.1 tagaturonate reductase [Liquorilactobacillus nagelii]QYH55333.1 tagaturonate reductase [Liquorilactobacillus nagelii DSM 13675]